VVFLAGAYGQEKEPKKEAPKEKTITITESQLEAIVEQKIAQQLIDDTQTLDAKILEPQNWHYAYYRGVEYTIYTGPGQMLCTRWAPPVKPEKPEDSVEKPEDTVKEPEKPIEK